MSILDELQVPVRIWATAGWERCLHRVGLMSIHRVRDVLLVG